VNEDGLVNYTEAITIWKQKDVLARNFPIATIEKQPQRTLLNCKAAFEMWTRLTSQHLQCAAENKHLLQKQFFDYKYKPGIHKITILHLPLYNYGNILLSQTMI
jgi:hypothetical protein